MLKWLLPLMMLHMTCVDAADALTIGYLELEGDPRYAERTPYARIRLRSESRPFPGARTAIEESAVIADAIDTRFTLQRFRGVDADELFSKLDDWRRRDIRLVLLDLPAEIVKAVSAKADDTLFFNLVAPEDSLRVDSCRDNLLHVAPSHAMKADALVQYLVSKDWARLMLVHGPEPVDGVHADAIERAARKFGAEIVARESFERGNDPRKRDAGNVALLTAGEEYDVVVVVDTEGEFGRYVPYRTRLARPVAGTTGLVAKAWSRVHERYGAPQVNERFEREAGRPMREADWAAWVAVKAIVQASLRTRTTAFEPLVEYLHGEDLNLDGSKGRALSFRSWNGQLRQPVFLATHDAVVATAPVEGFLHPTETLDTLGFGPSESRCTS